MDRRVEGHTSDLILGIVLSDTVCPVAAYMLTTQCYCECVVKHTWLWYLLTVIKHHQSPHAGAVLLSQGRL